MNTDKINRGSEWRKWDLHFHTLSSYDYKDKSVTNQEIIDTLAKNEISVVAITDHHTMDIDRIQKLQQLSKDKGITVLPGIEFLADARGKDPIHFIGIFSGTSNISYIWGQLKNTTNIKQIEGSNKKHNEVYCDLIDTMKLIKELGGITTIHAGSKTNNIENITNSLPHAIAQKEDIVDLVDIYELGKVTDKEGYIKNVFPNIGKYIPMIIASDNHDIKNYSLKENCWIKADPTFEGLKQIIYEPEERVRIQYEKPDFKEDKEIIDKVKFISPNNKFSNEEIYFNPNLNVIIGGKSSGKSILLYSIAKTLLADTKDKLLFKNNNEERYNLKSIDSDFDFEITTKAGISQKMLDRENDNSVIPNIKYIPQNELVKLAEPELSGKGESLNKLVRNLICEDTDSKQKYDDFIKNVKQYDKEREELINSYFETLDNIQNSETELKTKSNKEVLQTNIKTNSEKVEELNKKAGLSDEQIQQYKNFQEQQQQNQKRRELFNSDFSQTNAFLQELNKELSNLQERKNTFLQSIHKNEFRGYYQDKLKFIDDSIVQLQGLISEIGTIINSEGKRIFNTDNIFNEELKQINNEKSNIEEELKLYQQNEEVKKQIRTFEESIEIDGKLLSEIDSLNKKIEEKRQSIEEIKKDLFDLYKKSYYEYRNIVEQLKNRTKELEKDGLQIEGIAQLNFPKFYENILSFTDGRSASVQRYNILKNKKTRTAKYEYSELESQIEKIFEDILKKEYPINTRFSEQEIIKKLLDDYFYDYWEITYKNDKLGEMSTGKASFVILMLIIGLSKSKSPILIEQPEDNLDNRSVTKDLVSYLKMKKIERQIILVTHNANIVVNADAENVIVANQKGQNDKETTSLYRFDYINGAIENTFSKIETETDLLKSMGIKEHIADIVEGGKEAFKNRERKYSF